MANVALDRSGARSSRWWVIGGVALLVGLACAAYFPALHGQFILDDDALLTENALVKAPDGLYRMWFSREPIDYWPVANTTLWLEWRLWGMNPTGYHVTNLVLHIAASLLLWIVLRKLAIPGAYLAALLFAVHPVNVESIAWISQRKDALAVIFFLLSIFCYLRDETMRGAADPNKEIAAEESPDRSSSTSLWYWLSLLTFLLAMLSKGSVAILPGVLLLIVWWQRRRIMVPDLQRTVPFFLLAIVLSAVNLWFQRHGADIVVRDVSFTQRVLGAPAVVWFYLAKALAPIQLIFSYPQWKITADAWVWWLPLVAAVFITVLLARKYNAPQPNWGRNLLFAWLFFGLSLVPVLGLTDVGFMQYSLVADHYQHIAIIAVLVLIAATWSACYRHGRAARRVFAMLCAAGIVGLFAFLTFQQCRLYAGPITLYEATLAQNPTSWFAHNNLGIVFAKEKKNDDAKAHYDAALRLNPDGALTHYNLGNLFRRNDQFTEAIQEYQVALKLQPDYYHAHNNLGNALLAAGHPKEAAEEFAEALKRQPRSADARFNLGLALLNLVQLPNAINQFNLAVQLRPDFAMAHNYLGLALIGVGRVPDAVRHLKEAIRLQPNLVLAHRTLGFALAKSGNLEEAIAAYRETIKLDPDKPDDYLNLGDVLTNTGKFPEAIKELHRAIELKPEYPEAESKLAVALLNIGPPQEALDHCKRAIELRPDYTEAYANMALAYDQLQQRDQAIAAAEKAIELARTQEQKQEAEQIEAWLKTYRGENQKSENAAPQTSQGAS